MGWWASKLPVHWLQDRADQYQVEMSDETPGAIYLHEYAHSDETHEVLPMPAVAVVEEGEAEVEVEAGAEGEVEVEKRRGKDRGRQGEKSRVEVAVEGEEK